MARCVPSSMSGLAAVFAPASLPKTVSITKSAASIARWCRTSGWCSAGPGIRRRSESQVTVTLKPDGAGTLLTLSHEKFFDQAAADGHRNGWTGSLDRLEKFVA